MGMAASQGRLLSMTSRMSDLEFQSQSKCQSKIKLAMSTEDITRAYTEALNKKKFVGLTGTDSSGSPIYSDLTYDMLTGLNSPLAGDYCLTDSSDRMLATNEMKQNFDGKTLDEFLDAFNANTQTLVSPAVYPSGYDAATYPQAQAQLAAAVGAAQAKLDSTPTTIMQSDAEAAAAKQKALELNQSVYNQLLDAKATTAALEAILNPPPAAPASSSSSSKSGWKKLTGAVISGVDSALDTVQRATSVAYASVDNTAKNGIKMLPGGAAFIDAMSSDKSETKSTMSAEDMINRCKEMLAAAKENEAKLQYDADSAYWTWDHLPSTGGPIANPDYTTAVAELNAAKVSQGALGSVTPAVYSPTPEKTYYTNIYNRMAQGYSTQTDESKTINNKNWLSNQLKNGGLFLEKFDAKTGKTADQDLSGASEIMEVRDKEDLDIIEAKYDADMLAIQTKDKRLDMEIKQIDTEHSALQTEVESVQKVIQKNIESSFKTFG